MNFPMIPARSRRPLLRRLCAALFAIAILAFASGGVRADPPIDETPPPAPPPSPPPENPTHAAPDTSGPKAKPPTPAPPAGPTAAAAPPAAAPAAAPAAPATPVDWRAGDELDIKVLARGDLSCVVRVLADGTIDVPFSGRHRVTGKTLEEVRAAVAGGFSKQERDPQVAITVASTAPDEFYVLGEVGKAGVFTVPRTKKVTFLQALGMAGGFGPEADFTKVKILSSSGGDPRVVDASPARVAALAGVVVANGDTIVVPAVGRIYLMGQVNRTGGFAPSAGEKLTLSRALALAGGFTRLADTKSVVVTWTNAAGETVSARFNVMAILEGNAEDPAVYPGNLIFVPERLF